MKQLLRYLALVLFVYATAAWGEDGSMQAPGAVKDKHDQEVVCRRVRVTGTHFKQRVCKTRGQMKAEREAARRTMEARDRYNETIRGETMPAG